MSDLHLNFEPFGLYANNDSLSLMPRNTSKPRLAESRQARYDRRQNQTLENSDSVQRRRRRQTRSLDNSIMVDSDNEEDQGRQPDRNRTPDRQRQPEGQPDLHGLTQEQINQVKQFIAQQLAYNRQPAPIVKVRQINTTIEIPTYDSRKTNTKTYFTNLQKYFNAQGYEEDNFHNYLGGVLKGECKLWYEAHSHEIDSWRDFEYAFAQKFDSNEISRNRCKNFYSKRQQLVDPCEQFVYEMVALGKQVVEDGDNNIKLILATVRDAMHPEIGIAIADHDLYSIDLFLDRVSVVHHNLSRQSILRNGKQVVIPPLKGNRDDLVKQRQSEQSNRNDHSRGRSQFRSSFHGSRSQNNSQHRRNYEGTNSNSNHNNERNRNSSSRYSDSNHSRDGGGANQRNSSNYNRDRNQQQSNSNSRPDNNRGRGRGLQLVDVKCRKCSGFGHIARNCPNLNVAMSMYGTQIPQSNPFVLTNTQPNPFMQQVQLNPATLKQQQPSNISNPLSQYTASSNNSNPQNSETLNFLGRTLDNSNRGYSQH